jgi:hypothetical protein
MDICHPFCFNGFKGWHARPVKETVSNRLFAQPAQSPSGTGRAHFQHDPIDTHFKQTSTSIVQI